MGSRIHIVDAFTAEAFSGNPAAVCLLNDERDAAFMQRVAAEMNLSETAFLQARADGEWTLRWFTPKLEVDLCGHATLASAHMLWSTGMLATDAPAKFHTRSGVLLANRQSNGEIVLDFPAKPVADAEAPAGLEEAIGVPVSAFSLAKNDGIAVLDSEGSVRGAKPDIGKIAKLPVRVLMITARASTPGFDMASRFFAPNSGVNEDPVTGSAHCALGPYWAKKLGKTDLRALQVSARGGVLGARVRDSRVELVGRAVTVLAGDLVVA